MFYATPRENSLQEQIIKHQAGEEFVATGPPECRTELSPLGCTPAVQINQNSG